MRLDGYVSRWTFYSDVRGFYRKAAKDSDGRENEGWLGLYRAEDRPLVEGIARVAVVGRLSDCGRDYRQA